MRVKQISIFIENKEGRIAEVTSILAKASVNIRAISLADTTDFGVLRLIVNQTENAITALKNELVLLSDPWEKNATVIGIIGKTQGVRTPASPKKNDTTSSPISPRFALLTGLVPVMSATTFSPGVEIVILKSISCGDEHFSSSQAIYVT